ncbi:hypothetical protein AVEN_235602-1 [Araneus ventricosus]|uniref:Uncharacterized protein n=1 Tax=Araneus ventricosus TaxID=182803 RepID=A0A4Y2BQM2_ARAVE|nr:hypothetical protein AVEN_235602-1 [Araneus ventricosus]
MKEIILFYVSAAFVLIFHLSWSLLEYDSPTPCICYCHYASLDFPDTPKELEYGVEYRGTTNIAKCSCHDFLEPMLKRNHLLSHSAQICQICECQTIREPGCESESMSFTSMFFTVSHTLLVVSALLAFYTVFSGYFPQQNYKTIVDKIYRYVPLQNQMDMGETARIS